MACHGAPEAVPSSGVLPRLFWFIPRLLGGHFFLESQLLSRVALHATPLHRERASSPDTSWMLASIFLFFVRSDIEPENE